jgi:hypothetical protein
MYNRFAMGLIGISRTTGIPATRVYEKHKLVHTSFDAQMLNGNHFFVAKGFVSGASGGRIIDIPPAVEANLPDLEAAIRRLFRQNAGDAIQYPTLPNC